MATYCNQHWLLSHIRNSFISTDDTGMCETVMLSDDLPKHYLRKFQTDAPPPPPADGQQRRSLGGNSGGANSQRAWDQLQEVDFVCYPGLDQSDDEDMDLSSQSFDIQMYPEVGAHRFRSNTAQKLEKMDIARRKAARTKCINFDDEIVPPERSDFFVRKTVVAAARQEPIKTGTKPAKEQKEETEKKGQEVKENNGGGVLSKLTLQLANSPKQAQNKFMEYARFDGTSQTGIQTKRINVFLSMLPGRERNYPIKICVLASAKIIEVIGLVCYKATIQYPDIPLKSIRHYALYMTEDNDDMDDFPPLDNREPCSKFGFSHLTLAERRPLAPVTRIDYHNNHPTKSMTSEEDKARLAAAAVHSLQGIELNNDEDQIAALHTDDYEERMLNHNDMVESHDYCPYHLNIIDKRFFRSEVTLAISGESIEIDQHKNAKFWSKQKAVTYPIDSVAFCEIVERRHLKSTLRIWLKPASSSLLSASGSIKTASGDAKSSSFTLDTSLTAASGGGPHSPTSPSHYPHHTSPFAFFGNSSSFSHSHIRFKHYDFEGDNVTVEKILNKLECILKMRTSEVRREFMILRERKLEKNQAKKLLKV